MIVWGTGGGKETNRNMYEVAQISRQLSRPGWPEPTEFVDGIPMDYMMYGRLPGKPDSEVTQADMQKYNLLLIGTARQNSVVAKLSKDLPVKISTGRVKANDGLSWDCNDYAVGLLYYNPLAPRRLIYWVASESADFYKPESPLMGLQYWHMAAPDFLVMHATEEQIIAARRFDSHWTWEKDYADSPLLKEEFCSQIRHDENVARILRQKTGADFSLYITNWQSDRMAFAPGQTRWMDMLTVQYYDRVVTMELSGQKILDDMNSIVKARETAVAEMKAKQEEAKKKGTEFKDKPVRTLYFYPEPKPEDIVPQKLYSVVAGPWDVEDYVKATYKNPESLRNLTITMRDVLEQ